MNAKSRGTRRTRRHLTVRKVPRDVAEALERETRRRGVSLNQTVIDVLAQGLGIAPPGTRRSNGLKRLAGTWSDSDLEQFEAAITSTEQIDEELWR
jgi:hypothetical protein